MTYHIKDVPIATSLFTLVNILQPKDPAFIVKLMHCFIPDLYFGLADIVTRNRKVDILHLLTIVMLFAVDILCCW